MFTAVVIANNHYNALGIVRSLGVKKVPVILILTTKRKSFVEKSKYISSSVRIEENEGELVCTIQKICKEQNKYYIIPTTDFSSEVLDKNYRSFTPNLIIHNMGGNMNKAQNKLHMKLIAESCGLLVPKGKVSDLDYILNFAGTWSKFPAIIKPLTSINGNKGDITTVYNSDELKESLGVFKEKGYTQVLVEEYITSPDEYMIEVLGYCNVDYDPYIGGIIQKIREYPIKNGSTSYAKIINDHTALQKNGIYKLLTHYPYNGLYDMEFKYAAGKLYFIECNFRNGAPAYALTQNGVNLPYLWIMSFEKKDFKNEVLGYKFPYYFMSEHIDIINMFKKSVKFKKWLKQYLHSNKLFFNSSDIKPSIAYCIEIIQHLVKKVLKK